MEALAHALSGSTAGVASMSLLYPLENIRMRLQIQKKQRKADEASTSEDGSSPRFSGPLDCAVRVVEKEGVAGLSRGLGSALFGIAVSSSVYFFFYSLIKNAALRHYSVRNLGPVQNLCVASAAGAVNCFITLPFWVVNTRMTLQAPSSSELSSSSSSGEPKQQRYKSIGHGLATIFQEEGFRALYAGLVPSLILVSNPAIQFATYEQLVRTLLSAKRVRLEAKAAAMAAGKASAAAVRKASSAPLRLSTAQYFLLGAVAKALATVITYPYQVVKTRAQTKNSKYRNTLHAIRKMYREEGLGAFYQGMGAKLWQTVLNSALLFVFYERILAIIQRRVLAVK